MFKILDRYSGQLILTIRHKVLYNTDLRWVVAPGADLAGVDLHGSDLRGIRLNSSSLRKANLRRTDMRFADLVGADFRGADFRGADLRNTDMRFVDLAGADFKGTDLRNAWLYGADCRGADFRGAKLAYATLTKANLEGAKLDLPVEEGLLHKVAVAALSEPHKLNMNKWHAPCGTAHCIAGWACTLAPNGKELEEQYGTEVAGLFLLGHTAHSKFHESWEMARSYLLDVLGKDHPITKQLGE